MLRPTPKESQVAESDNNDSNLREHKKKLQRVDELKDKIRMLIETPLFMNADLLKEGCMEDGSRIL